MLRVAFRYAPLGVLLLIWEAVTLVRLVPSEILPGPLSVLNALRDLIVGGDLVSNAARSLLRAAYGYGLAVVVGILLGLTMATSRPMRLVLNPLVQLFYPMPKSALIPLVMIWFGLGDASKIFLIFLGCLLPVIISTYNGARGVNHYYTWSAASLGASRFDVLREIVLPAAMPEILAGCRTALAFSFILMVSSEFIIAKDGVGFLISTLGDGGAYPSMFAVILVVSLAGFAADQTFAAFMRRRLRWRNA